jgi:hypothetical protein
MPNSGTIPREDWDHTLYNLLIRAGTNGMQHNDIVHRLQAKADTGMIKAKLEAWYAEKKVQKFEQRTKGRPRIIWQATKLLLTEYATPQEDDDDDDSE